MKNIFTAILFLSFTIGFGQESKSVKGSTPHGTPLVIDENLDYSQIFNSVQVPASPQGGLNAFREFINSSFKLPEVTQKTTGTVIAKFVVWDDGSIRDVVIVKENPAGLGLGKEAYRILLNSPKWTPGKINNKNVKQYYTLPISIQILPKEKAGQSLEELTEEELDYNQVFTTVEVYAFPPGGMNAFKKYITSSFKVPKVDQATTANVIAKFVVWEDGSINEIQIVKEEPNGLDLGKELTRLLEKSEKWEPGVFNGRKVKQYFSLPLSVEILPSRKVGQIIIAEIKKEAYPSVTDNKTIMLEKQAEPVGGLKKFYNQLSSNMQVPEIEIAGTYKTKVKFLVNQDGSLSDFQVIEETPSNIGLGQNVIKYLQSIEKWIPGEQNGKKVKTYFVLPVTTIIEKEPELEPKKEKK